MIDIRYINEEEKTYQEKIKKLEQQVEFFTNKSQRLEKENKELNEQIQVLAEKLVNISGAEGLIKLNINLER